jgi:hypothetical protein
MATYTPTYITQKTGLINQPTRETAVAVGGPDQVYNPTTRQVDPNELTSTQLNQITSSGSPLMQRAAAQGRAAANNRGLINSSLAAQSAQNAVIEHAAPIAQADAGAYQTAAQQNQQFQNQAGQFNAGNAFQREGENINALNRAGEVSFEAANDLNKLNLSHQFDLENLKTEYGLKNAQLQIAADIQKEQEAYQQGNELQKAYVSNSNTLMNNYLNGWFKVQESDMTPAQKTSALNEYNATIRTWQSVLNTAYASLPAWENEWGMTFS